MSRCQKISSRALGALFLGALLVWPAEAYAYVGPGSGLAAIATLFSLVGAVVMAIVGFVWFPIRRLIRKLTKSEKQTDKA